jgi:hypothetical protein
MGGEGVLNEHIAMQRVATVGLPYTTEFFILTVCVWIMKFGGSGLPNFFAERNETMCT